MWQQAEDFLSKDKYIGPLVRKYGPCSIKKRPKTKYFETLVRAIVGQQLSTKAASTIYDRFSTKVGRVTPENILKARKNSLRNCGLSNAKCEYVKDLAKKVKNGELEISRLDDLVNEKIIEELIAVKGIGKWTAEMFLMFSLARPDVFPVDDLGILRGTEKLLKRKMNSQKIGQFALRWKPHRTVACWYLWRSLNND